MVAVLSYAMATILNLSERERLDALEAGFVADIGLEFVPHHLLTCRGRLSVSEHDIIKQHPAEGVGLLRSMGYTNEGMLEIVRATHEACNGTGYPNGLRGDDIPMAARIIAVADTYDALTSWRPSREAWARDAALEEIRRGASTGRYEPRVVDALIKLVG